MLAQTTIDLLIEIFLMVVIVVLLGWMLMGKGGVVQRRKLERELEELKMKMQRSASWKGVVTESEPRTHPGLFDFVRDLETLRCALAGSRICQRSLYKKYRLSPGPELLKKILAQSKIDPTTKERLADEFLVGEVGRGLMKSLNAGTTIERASAEVGVPMIVAKGQISRLQVLGYMDNRLKPTEMGLRSLG